MAPPKVEKPVGASGYQFRCRVDGTFVRCVVGEAVVQNWAQGNSLGDLDAIKEYARRIMRSHLRDKPAGSAWVVEIGLDYVRCEVEQPGE